MVNIYTDASISSGKAVVSYIILTDSNYIGYETKDYDNIHSSLEAELYGILDSIHFAKNLGLDDSVCIYTDSGYAIQLVNTNIQDKLPTVNETVSKIKELLKSLNWELDYIKGHQINHNPNKTVDTLSRTLVRLYAKGETYET